MRHYGLTVRTAAQISLILALAAFFLIGCSNHQTPPSGKKHNPATEQRFKDIEFWVKIFEDPERDAWQKPLDVVEAMNLKPGNVVADIGAGTGYLTRHLAVAVGPEGKALGLDIEQSMVDYMIEDAKKLGLTNYTAKVVKTDDPELVPGSVDVIFLCNTYHHISDRVEYFQRALKGLKPNGRVISVDFYKNIDFGPPRDHKIAKEVVLSEMKKAGYKLNRDLKFLQHQYYLEFVPE